MPKKKELEDLAKTANAIEAPAEPITEADLLEVCPKELMTRFKKAKSAAARADFLYEFDKGELKAARDHMKKMEAFASKLKMWFIQEYKDDDQKGVIGKIAKVEIKRNTVPRVVDWDKFYSYVKKNNAFELLNRAVNAKSVEERWEQKKNVAGVEPYPIDKLSLTKAGK